MQIKILATSDMHMGTLCQQVIVKKDGFAFWNRKSSNHAEKLRASAKGPVFKLKMGFYSRFAA